MSFETIHLLRTAGLWLILGTAGLMLVVTIMIARPWPGLAWRLMVVAWVTGTLGFTFFSIVEPRPVNIGLGVLFVASSVYHGVRLRRRTLHGASCEQPPQDHIESP